MNHQDWEQITINNKPKINKKIQKKTVRKLESTAMDVDDLGNGHKLKKKKVIDSKLSREINEKRLLKNFKTQKDLANRLNINIVEVRRCETIGSTYNVDVLNKIKRVLGIPKNPN